MAYKFIHLYKHHILLYPWVCRNYRLIFSCSWDKLQPPRDPECRMDGWIDVELLILISTGYEKQIFFFIIPDIYSV